MKKLAPLKSLGRVFARLAGVFGPLFAKELRVAARRKRNYWMRGAYLALLTLAVCIAWVSLSWTIRLNSAAGIMGLGRLAPTLLITCGWFQLFGLTLIAPILTSGTISEERTHRTLGVLLMTPITPFQIVSGKFLSRTLQLLLLVGLTLPVLATVQVFGGLETKAVLEVLGLCLSAGLFAGALGMLISTYSDRVYVTILNCYFLLLGLFLVVPIGLGWIISAIAMNSPNSQTSFALAALMAALNPFMTMFFISMDVLSPGMTATAGFGRWARWIAPLCTATFLAATGLLMLLATLRVRGMSRSRLRRPPKGDGSTPLQSPPKANESQRAERDTADDSQEAPSTVPAEVENDGVEIRSETPPTLDPGNVLAPERTEVVTRPSIPVAKPRTREVGDNPVLWRELSQRIAGTSRWWWVGLVLLLLCAALVYALAATNDSLDDEELHGMILPIFLLLILLEAGVFAAPTITSEKEASSWPILLSTTLRPRQILLSKAAGVIRRLVPISLLLVGHVLIFTIVGFLNPLCLLHSALIVGGFVSFLISVGIWLSLRLEKTTSAVVGTVLTGFVLWAILPIVVGTLWGVMDGGDEGFEMMAFINPMFWMGFSGAGAVESVQRGGATSYWIFNSRTSATEFTTVLFAVCSVYFLVAAGIFASSVKHFNRFVGRPS